MNCLYVCQSVILLTSLLKLDKYGDISCSWWYIFLIFLGGIPEMCLHHFPIIAKCLYVCQSVSWLTSLLKLDKCRFISCSWWDIFLNFFGDIPEVFVHWFQMLTNFLYVWQSVSWLTNWLKLGQYRDISCSGWEIFQKFWRTFLGCFYTISK